MKNAHEFVMFKFKNEISLEDQKALMAKIENCAKKLTGFISRDYFYSEDNQQWIDHVIWSDNKAAQNASEAIMKDPAAGEIFMNIDNSTVSMSHYQQLNK